VPSLIVTLPVWAAAVVFMVVMLAVAMLVGGVGAVVSPEGPPEEPPLLFMLFMFATTLVFCLVLAVVQMVMWFAFVALWQGHETGKRALVAGWQVVRDNLLSTVGLVLMFFLVVIGATIAGTLALCVGNLVALPFVMIWVTATCIVLFRSWSAQST
jgi:hypothetical protein